VGIAQTTVVSVSPFAVTRFVRIGKIAKRAPAIVELVLIHLSVGMLRVTVKKHAHHVLRIAVNVLLQIRIVGMEHVNTITMRTASYAQKTVEHVLLLLIQSVAMEHAIQMKIVLLAPATVRVLVFSHRVLKEKCEMIQMSV
jgi:hypothetical protein